MNITTSLTTSEEIIAKSRAGDGDDGDGVGVGGRVLTCVGCRSTITDQYILQVSPDLEWHVDCLRCNECHQPLDEQKTCFVRNGKTYCKADYLRLFGIKCVGCRLGFKMSDLVMRTRHRIFHLECFRCSICRRRLIPGDEYALDDDHDPVALYCRHDYDAIVISPRSPSSVGLPPPLTPKDTLLIIRGADGNDDETKAATTNDDVTSDNNNDLKTTTNENRLSSSPHNNTSTTSNSSNSNSSASGPGGGLGGGGGATGMVMLKSTASVAMVGKRGGGGGGGTGGSRSSGGGSAGGGGGRSLHAKSSDHHPKTTRVRTVLNEKQLHTLRTCYAANPRPDALMKDQLVEMTGLSSRVIRVWFQNKRCKDKKRTILIKQIQQQQQQHNDKLHGGGIPLIATSPVQHDPSSSSSSSALIQVNPVEIHRFIHHHHSTSSSWNSISSSVAASSLAAAAAATEGGGGVTGGPSYDPLNQPPLQISTFDARDPGQDQASSQGHGHVMASFQQLLSSFGESDDDDTVVSLEETSAAAAAGLQGPLTPGLHPPPPPISIGRGTQPPASATASVALQASRVAMQRIARFSNDLHLRHPSRLSIHHHHHHPHHHPHHHHQQQQQHLVSQSPPSLPPHLFNNASITSNSSSSSNFISTATHLIQQSAMKAFDTKC